MATDHPPQVVERHFDKLNDCPPQIVRSVSTNYCKKHTGEHANQKRVRDWNNVETINQASQWDKQQNTEIGLVVLRLALCANTTGDDYFWYIQILNSYKKCWIALLMKRKGSSHCNVSTFCIVKRMLTYSRIVFGAFKFWGDGRWSFSQRKHFSAYT